MLLAINGVGSLVGGVLTWRRHLVSSAVALGAFLMVWILAQVSWLGLRHWLQPLYFALGLVESIIGLRLRGR